jgi:hypothetical protein
MGSWEWKEHITIAIGVISTLIIVMRLLVVADFDAQTAYAVLKSGGTTPILLGVSLSYVWAIAAVGAILVFYVDKQNRSAGDNAGSAAVFAIIVATIVNVLTAPIVVWAFSISVALLIFITSLVLYLIFHAGDRAQALLDQAEEHVAAGLRASRSAQRALRRRHKRAKAGLFFSLAVIAIIMITDKSPWLPIEVINVSGSSKQYVGYVLSVDDNTLALLNDRPRQVEYVQVKNQTVNRRICVKRDDSFSTASYATTLKRPIVAFIGGGHPRYARCP